MKKIFPVDELARDARFVRVNMIERMQDPRTSGGTRSGRPNQRLTPDMPEAPDGARALMHGIFVGEIQALEGAGRTCFDFEVGTTDADVPFALKLDMARQCWDEARHCEISVKLSDWMGTEIGEYSESPFLYEAACNPDPVLRLTGVNRALEGLAIDVFNTMKEFGEISGDPILEFCEDWMLADEVTHVKMGSDWLRKLTEKDPDRVSVRSSSSVSSTSCSPWAVSGVRTTTARSSWLAASASSPGSTPTRWTSWPRSHAKRRSTRRRCAIGLPRRPKLSRRRPPRARLPLPSDGGLDLAGEVHARPVRSR